MEAAVNEGIRDVLDDERRLGEMPAKRFVDHLTGDERAELLGLITKEITSARRHSYQTTPSLSLIFIMTECYYSFGFAGY